MTTRSLRLLMAVVVVWAVTSHTAAQPPTPVGEDVRLLQGEWALTGYEVGGRKAPADALKQVVVTFTKEKVVFQPSPVASGSGAGTTFKAEGRFEARYTLGAAAKARTFDMVPVGGTTPMKGLYQLDADSLQICWSIEGERPAEFSAPEGSPNRVMQLKRTKR